MTSTTSTNISTAITVTITNLFSRLKKRKMPHVYIERWYRLKSREDWRQGKTNYNRTKQFLITHYNSESSNRLLKKNSTFLDL